MCVYVCVCPCLCVRIRANVWLYRRLWLLSVFDTLVLFIYSLIRFVSLIDGFYFYIETKLRYSNKAARLVSPLIRPNGLQCFTVWYHMYGSDIGSFNVYVFTGPDLPSPAFHRYGTRANKWLRADIQFHSESPYNVSQNTWKEKFSIHCRVLIQKSMSFV